MIKIFIGFLFCISTLGALENSTITSGPDRVNWDEYFQRTLNQTRPWKTCFLAQEYFEKEGKQNGLALDLGTGTGRDALFLLKKGWHVVAIDAEALALEIFLNRAAEEQLSDFEVNVSPFEQMILPENIDLINASFSLPFCSPKNFPTCWQNIVDHLAISGRFAGQFFGDRDDWAANPNRTFFTETEVLQLFADNFEIEYFQVQEGTMSASSDPTKHWHVYHVIAKKIK